MQGEGKYTGAPSIWIRLFLCQLQCDGFSQKDPTDASTYELPYKDFDVDSVDRVEDLPVWEYGCDSSYTWAKKFKKLMHNETPEDVVDRLEGLLPDGKWGNFHFCITGGEPLLKNNQKAVVSMLEVMVERGNFPKYITFETNSVEPVKEPLLDILNKLREEHGVELFMSLSPKLFRVSGETEDKAINYSSIRHNCTISDDYQLKFVVDTHEETWNDMERILGHLERDIQFPAFHRSKIWTMPVGAREEEQNDIQKEVADMTIAKGYNFAARVHCMVHGNFIGT
jgi:organic radical activating enzyme